MLRLSHMIADGLAVVAVGVSVATIGASYARNIPNPIAQVAEADDALPAWLDPETTGAIIPKAESTSVHVKPTQPKLKTESTVWVDPPRRSAAVIDQTMELRLPRP